MPTIAFWNLHQHQDVRFLVQFLHQYGIEILVVAERTFAPGELLLNYANLTEAALHHIESRSGVARVDFFSTFPPERFTSVWESRYAGCFEYHPQVGESLILFGVHLPSKLHLNKTEQLIEAQTLRSQIERIETASAHSRTIILGDFNMDPFEEGMVANHALHGVMDRRIAEKGSRSVLFQESTFFFNPMWKPMGDSSAQALGTYFRGSGMHIHYFWNTFDQVLIRPSLLSFFRNDDLQIVDSIAGTSLLSAKPPGINDSLSDHLPVVFKVQT
jgi:hypothetical protein